jgi:hypothetical protein
MKYSHAFAVIGMASLANAAACSDDDATTTTTATTTATTTTTTTGGGGGEGGMSSTTTGVGGMTTTGVGGSGGEGGVGGGVIACMSCSVFITQCAVNQGVCPPESTLCPGSDALFSALKTCACNECALECELTCTGQGQDQNGCTGCYQAAAATSCGTELQACQADL